MLAGHRSELGFNASMTHDTDVLIGGGGYSVYKHHGASAADGKPGMGAADREIPVVAVAARTGDLKLYLDGLGSVTALPIPATATPVASTINAAAPAAGSR